LKDSDIKGPKFLTGKEREKLAKDKEFADFDREMERYRSELLDKLNRRSSGGEIS